MSELIDAILVVVVIVSFIFAMYHSIRCIKLDKKIGKLYEELEADIQEAQANIDKAEKAKSNQTNPPPPTEGDLGGLDKKP